jgi:murein endopeptidase
MRRLLALTALVAVTGAIVLVAMDGREGAKTRGAASARDEAGGATTRGGDGAGPAAGDDAHGRGEAARRRRAATPRIVWRSSVALGVPTRGRLVRGVKLPVRGAHFLTWDPVRKVTPNRWWRRYGTDVLVRILLRVARAYAKAHPDAPRLLIGDLSRPQGGDFGRRYGPLGHVSHQNGLDADVYFPRRDGRERAPRRAAQVDRRLAQDLVDRFRRAGVRTLLAGPSLRLRGTQPWPNHDDHLHVRLAGPK